MILLSTFIATVFISLLRPTETYQESHGKVYKAHMNSLATLVKSNKTYENFLTDKDERTIVTPKIPQINKIKKRNVNKNPKRTIQKIIRMSRKNKKTFKQVTRIPTKATTQFQSTAPTPAMHLKRMRKYYSKLARYRLPSQKPSAKKEAIYQRIRRDAGFANQNILQDLNFHGDRKSKEPDRDIYILQDLDEMEVVNNEDGTNTIKAHVKNYW